MYEKQEYNYKRCPVCNVPNHKYKKCVCKLKDPKKVKCRVKYKQFVYTGVAEITWYDTPKEEFNNAEAIDIIWERDPYVNPFQHSVVDFDCVYYNLALARKVYFMSPSWVLYHKKVNEGFERCYCSGYGVYLENEDFEE